MDVRTLVLLTALALFTGCASTSADWHVRLDAVGEDGEGLGYGHGVLIDSSTVVTVEHVAEGEAIGHFRVSRASVHHAATRRIRYVKAKVSHYLSGGNSVERLAVLKLASPMTCDVYPKMRSIEKGDSGSPIMGKRGEVIGLVTGYRSSVYFMGRITRGRTIFGTNGPMGPIPRDPVTTEAE